MRNRENVKIVKIAKNVKVVKTAENLLEFPPLIITPNYFGGFLKGGVCTSLGRFPQGGGYRSLGWFPFIREGVALRLGGPLRGGSLRGGGYNSLGRFP